jgi:short-subunit dehydrogenase involved in D-alanine esterification of teichoic acids
MENSRMITVDKNKKPVAVVTGSSSGIGYETSLLLARNGFFTYATERSPDKSGKFLELKGNEKLSLEVLKLDVTNDKSVKEAVEKIVSKQGTIDVLVNNAGYALVGPLEELSIQEFKEQFETNVFGVIRVIKETLPIMRKKRHGIIVNMSSVAGRVGFPLTSAYVSCRPIGMLIYSPSGNGKTTILRTFALRHQAIITEVVDFKPVVSLQAPPSPGEKRFLGEIVKVWFRLDYVIMIREMLRLG